MSPDHIKIGEHTPQWWEDFWSHQERTFGQPREELIAVVDKRFGKLLAKGVKVTLVDVGSGNGRYAIPFAKIGYTTSAVEYTESGCRLISSLATANDLAINVTKGDFTTMEDPEIPYDVVFSSGLLEEIEGPGSKEQSEVIERLKRWVKPDGLLVFKYCLEIKDRGLRVPDGFAIEHFRDGNWLVIQYDTEPMLRQSLANITFENAIRTETIIAIKLEEA